jgi:hypothetical protein
VSARIAAVLVGLALLAVGCDSGDSGDDSSRPSPRKTDDATPWYESPGITEACRTVFENLPPERRDATTEEAFVDKCQGAVSGLPDPGLNELS